MSYQRGQVIPQKTGLPAREVATLTKQDRRGMFWIRIQKQWLLVMPFSDDINMHPDKFAIFDVKDEW